MNQLIKTKPHFLVIFLSFAVACFSDDVAYNFGRLFTISLLALATASFFGRNSEPQKALSIKLFASLIPLVVISVQLYDEYNQKQSLNSIKQSLSQQKEIYRSSLLDEDLKVSSSSNIDLNFSKFKTASSTEDLFKQLSELVKFSNHLTISINNEQKKLLAEMGWNDSLSPDKLASMNDAISLRVKAGKYNDFLDRYSLTFDNFVKDYRDSFHLIAKNYPKETKGFDTSLEQSIQNTKEFNAIQKETVKEITKLSYLLEEGYKKQLVQYSSSSKNLVFYDSNLLSRYNQSIENLSSLARTEENLLKKKYEALQKLEKKLSN